MKKIMIIAVLAIAAISCNMEGYSEYNLTSISTFEFDSTNFTDSLFVTAPFYGGSSSYNILFNSQREDTKEPATGGVVLTMKKDSSIVLKEDNTYPQYTIFGKAAASQSNVCAVFYQNPGENMMPDHDIIFEAAEYGTCTPAYFMINNTQLTVHDVLADDSELKFEPGDYLKLTITGTLEGSKTGSVEYYLADYRGGGEQPDSVLTAWKTVSLSKLGQIQYIDFSLETNKENFPTYFCFDNLVASVYMKY